MCVYKYDDDDEHHHHIPGRHRRVVDKTAVAPCEVYGGHSSIYSIEHDDDDIVFAVYLNNGMCTKIIFLWGSLSPCKLQLLNNNGGNNL